MHICDLQGENVPAMRLLRRGCSTLPLDMHGMLTREGTQMRVSDGQKQALEPSRSTTPPVPRLRIQRAPASTKRKVWVEPQNPFVGRTAGIHRLIFLKALFLYLGPCRKLFVFLNCTISPVHIAAVTLCRV